LVVVVEGDKRDFDPILHHHRDQIDRVVFKEVQGRWGAYAKDVGLSEVRGDYVCFWDDDNVYYPHALATLYATTSEHDLGIVRCSHMASWFKELPRSRQIEFGNIDTMCFCVRRQLAVQAKWADHADKGTDFAYIKKLLDLKPTIRWVDIGIGEKLLDDMKGL
jgi:glycosyltransferase involved in cell wall biosynthesis